MKHTSYVLDVFAVLVRLSSPRASNIGIPNIFGIVADFTFIDTSTVDPPPILLGIHRVIVRILFLSGAGEYIDNLLRDLDKGHLKEDGTTDVGGLLAVRLGLAPNVVSMF